MEERNRCISRLFWDSLTVFNHRSLTTETEIKDALFHHNEYATNEGKIRPSIPIFKQKTGDQQIRIWNHQLVRYAGYETEHGILGESSLA